MKNNNKNQFKEMLDTLFDIYDRRHADQNLLRVWWGKLLPYPIDIISKAFDVWTSNQNKCPTPYDILLICRSKTIEANANQKQITAKPMSNEKKELVKQKLKDLMHKMREKQ